ncbi:hypothetical protein DL765_000096 [Monosporascus sp. GIB2]|nr:hypothetical protein DL765_000096 [Monosporascus sp. GIB2]
MEKAPMASATVKTPSMTIGRYCVPTQCEVFMVIAKGATQDTDTHGYSPTRLSARGVFGNPTAYHLAQRGHASVTVLDRFSAPSEDSAATDLNKVICTDCPNQLYTKLGLEAMQFWKDSSGDSILRGVYRETGWIMSAHARPPNGCRLAEALLRMANAARANGVRYICGDGGHVKKWIYNSKGTCTGAISANGRAHQADVVILASGSNTVTLVERKEEVVAQTMVICVIKLEPHEIEKYKTSPSSMISSRVCVNAFRPQSAEDRNRNSVPADDLSRHHLPARRERLDKAVQLPVSDELQEQDPAGGLYLTLNGRLPVRRCPKEVEDEMRTFIRDMIPELADRPLLLDKAVDGLAVDLSFRICPYPDTEYLYVATIGSNHEFKLPPVICKYVVDMLQRKLGQVWLDLWKWKFRKRPDSFQDPHPLTCGGALRPVRLEK